MSKNVLKLNNNEEITIYGNNNNKIMIKNLNNKLHISEVNINKKSNVFIKKFTLDEMNCFVLTYLLENANITSQKTNTKDNRNSINKLLDNYYNIILGNNYNTSNIKKIEFQSITYYN